MKNIEGIVAVLDTCLGSSDNEPLRLFHGRGQSFPPFDFINIDQLHSLALITLYRDWAEENLQCLARYLLQAKSSGIKSVILQRRYLKPVAFELLAGEVSATLEISEAGLKYLLRFDAGLHTGLFLDMAEARQWLCQRAKDKRVLNLFSYTCAFSVVAVSGGAKSVINVDMSRSSLTRGRDNHRLNGQDLRKVRFLAHDIFRSWGKLKRFGPYDMVVIDPPSYQPGSFIAAKDYPRIFARLPEMLAAGASLLVCLNDPQHKTEYLRSMVEQPDRGLVYQERLKNPDGFSDIDPERSLKVLHYKYFPTKR